jgi:hypothetical protein
MRKGRTNLGLSPVYVTFRGLSQEIIVELSNRIDGIALRLRKEKSQAARSSGIPGLENRETWGTRLFPFV